MGNNTFSKRLAELRIEKGVKREEIAKLLNCSVSAISNYENGNRTPDFDSLILLADYFDTTTDYLLGRTEIKSSNIDIKKICEYTGLEEGAIKKLHYFTAVRNEDIEDMFVRPKYKKKYINKAGFTDYEKAKRNYAEDIKKTLVFLSAVIEDEEVVDLSSNAVDCFVYRKENHDLEEYRYFKKCSKILSNFIDLADCLLKECSFDTQKYGFDVSNTVNLFLDICYNQKDGESNGKHKETE